MTEKKEYREFYVEKFNGHRPPSYKVYTEEPEIVNLAIFKQKEGEPTAAFEYFHVIEHQAYLDMKAERDKWKEMVEKLMKSLKTMNKGYACELSEGQHESAFVAAQSLFHQYKQFKKEQGNG